MVRSCLCVVICSTLLMSLPAFAAIDLQVTYTVAAGTAVGTVSIPGSLDFVLEGREVAVYDTTNGGRALLGTRSGRYGNFFGPVIFKAHYRGNMLDFSAIYASHVINLRVQTDGRSSCSASVSNRLKPGHSVYEVTDPTYGHLQLTSLETSGVSCRLSTM